MTKLAISIQPFAMKQKAYLYKDNTHLSTFTFDLTNNFATEISAICKRYNVDTVLIKGNKSFMEKYVNQLKSNYDMDNVTIKFID